MAAARATLPCPLPRAPTLVPSRTPAAPVHVPVRLEPGQPAAVNTAGAEHRHSSPHVCLDAYGWGDAEVTAGMGSGNVPSRLHPHRRGGKRARPIEREALGPILPARPLGTPGRGAGAWGRGAGRAEGGDEFPAATSLIYSRASRSFLSKEPFLPARTPSPASTSPATHGAPAAAPAPTSTPRSHSGHCQVPFGSPRSHSGPHQVPLRSPMFHLGAPDPTRVPHAQFGPPRSHSGPPDPTQVPAKSHLGPPGPTRVPHVPFGCPRSHSGPPCPIWVPHVPLRPLPSPI